MKKKYSGDLGLNIIFVIIEPLIFIVLWLYADMKFTPTIIICIVVYILFCVRYIRFFEFKEDFYEVSFPVRICKRKIKIYYSEIKCVEYVLRRGNQGEKLLKIYPNTHKTHFWESKYIVACSQKYSRPLLCFLKGKGIKIKIVDDKYNKEYADLLEPEENQQKVRYYR